MEIEEQVIHKALEDNDRNILSTLSFPTVFQNPFHQTIWRLSLEYFNTEQPVTFQSIHQAINKDKDKNKEDLHKRLSEIEAGVYWYDESSMDEIVEQWQFRVFRNLGKKLQHTGTDNLSLDEAIEEVEKHHELVKNISNEKKIFITLKDVEKDILERKVEDLSDYRLYVPGITMSKIFGEYMLPRFYIMAGLPSMGKNLIVDRLVCSLLLKNKGVYYSFDNSAMETGYMIKSMTTGILYKTIETGILTEEERQKISVTSKISNNLFITSKRLNIDKIRLSLEKLKGSDEWKDIRFFVIDYFQNIPFRPGRRNNEVVEYEHMAREINAICNDLGITAIVLSQSKDRGRDTHSTFSLNDLKWCGGLAQDAFYVVGIEGERETAKKTIKIAKNKRGKLESFDIEYNYFTGEVLPFMSRG